MALAVSRWFDVKLQENLRVFKDTRPQKVIRTKQELYLNTRGEDMALSGFNLSLRRLFGQIQQYRVATSHTGESADSTCCSYQTVRSLMADFTQITVTNSAAIVVTVHVLSQRGVWARRPLSRSPARRKIKLWTRLSWTETRGTWSRWPWLWRTAAGARPGPPGSSTTGVCVCVCGCGWVGVVFPQGFYQDIAHNVYYIQLPS